MVKDKHNKPKGKTSENPIDKEKVVEASEEKIVEAYNEIYLKLINDSNAKFFIDNDFYFNPTESRFYSSVASESITPEELKKKFANAVQGFSDFTKATSELRDRLVRGRFDEILLLYPIINPQAIIQKFGSINGYVDEPESAPTKEEFFKKLSDLAASPRISLDIIRRFSLINNKMVYTGDKDATKNFQNILKSLGYSHLLEGKLTAPIKLEVPNDYQSLELNLEAEVTVKYHQASLILSKDAFMLLVAKNRQGLPSMTGPDSIPRFSKIKAVFNSLQNPRA